MIVAGPQGLDKSAYRKFRIRNAQAAGDDYAMMREVLTRRFGRAVAEDPDRTQGQWPDLVLIDGGAGQLAVARRVLQDLGVHTVAVAAIAKGLTAMPAMSASFFPTGRRFQPNARDPVLYFLQRLRDEAHRFAIGSHRAAAPPSSRRRRSTRSPALGRAARRRCCTTWPRSRRAPDWPISGGFRHQPVAAKKIYDWFHPER